MEIFVVCGEFFIYTVVPQPMEMAEIFSVTKKPRRHRMNYEKSDGNGKRLYRGFQNTLLFKESIYYVWIQFR